MVQNILFVCVENAGRSQMAEAFFKKYGKGKFDVISAGTIPSTKLNPIVVSVMAEIKIDMTFQTPKLLSGDMIEQSFKTIKMGCVDKESCPALFVKDIVDLNISDPKNKTIEQVRIIRDDIKSNVLKMIDFFND